MKITKRILTVITALAAALTLLMALAVTVNAAPTGTLSGPDAIRAGEEFTLKYTVSEAAAAFQLDLEYDDTQLELIKHESVSGWSIMSDSGRFTTFGSMDENFRQVLATDLLSITFRVKDTVAGGTEVAVAIRNVLLTVVTGEDEFGEPIYDEAEIPDVEWKGSVAVPLSSDATLKSLKVEGYSFPFAPTKTNYYFTVEHEVTKLVVTAEANDSKAKVDIRNVNELVAGEANRIRIVVTAENGDYQTYNLYVTRKAAISTDNTLKELKIDGVSIAFSKNKTEYNITVENSVKQLKITATPTDSKASVAIKNNALIAGQTVTVDVVVTAEDGSTRTYHIHAARKVAEPEPPVTKPPQTTEPPVTPPPVTKPPQTTTPPDTEPPVVTNPQDSSPETTMPKETDPESRPSPVVPNQPQEPANPSTFWQNAIYIIILVGAFLVIALLLVILIIYHRMNSNANRP